MALSRQITVLHGSKMMYQMVPIPSSFVHCWILESLTVDHPHFLTMSLRVTVGSILVIISAVLSDVGI